MLQSPHNLRVYGSHSLKLTLKSTDAVRNLGCYSDRHATGPTRVQLLLYGILSSTLDQQNPTPADTRRLPCRNTLSCAVLSCLDYCKGGLKNGLTNRLQRAQNSTYHAFSTQPCQTERSYLFLHLSNRLRRRDPLTVHLSCPPTVRRRDHISSLSTQPSQT